MAGKLARSILELFICSRRLFSTDLYHKIPGGRHINPVNVLWQRGRQLWRENDAHHTHWCRPWGEAGDDQVDHQQAAGRGVEQPGHIGQRPWRRLYCYWFDLKVLLSSILQLSIFESLIIILASVENNSQGMFVPCNSKSKRLLLKSLKKRLDVRSKCLIWLTDWIFVI